MRLRRIDLFLCYAHEVEADQRTSYEGSPSLVHRLWKNECLKYGGTCACASASAPCATVLL